LKLTVKAHPKSSKRKLIQKSPAEYEVWVHEPADKGRANAAVIEVLAEYLDIPKSRLKIVSGLTSKNKIIDTA
jgi:uncharacterized protein YggU (UPF0235/DUF167 family)